MKESKHHNTLVFSIHLWRLPLDLLGNGVQRLATWADDVSSGRLVTCMVCSSGHVVHILIHIVTTTTITTAAAAAATYLCNLLIHLVYMCNICIYMFHVLRACCQVSN